MSTAEIVLAFLVGVLLVEVIFLNLTVTKNSKGIRQMDRLYNAFERVISAKIDSEVSRVEAKVDLVKSLQIKLDGLIKGAIRRRDEIK